MDEQQKYRIIFKGEIAPQTDPEAVKKNLAALFNVGVQEVEQLFSGKRFVLKENAGAKEAQEYKEQFEKTGAICMVVRIEDTGAIPKPPKPTPPVSKTEEPSPPESPEPTSPVSKAEDTGAVTKPPGPTPTATKNEYLGAAPEPPGPTPPDREKPRPTPGSTADQTESRYRLMFSGETLAGKDLSEVKTQLCNFYKVGPDRIEVFFTGKPVVIVDSIDFWTAVSYWHRFKNCGAVSYLETVEPGKPVDEPPGKYKIVFDGGLQAGQDVLEVKARLAAFFKVPGEVADKLFLGKPVLVRTSLSPEAAQSYKTNFEKTGAHCQAFEIPATPLPSPAPPSPAPQVPEIEKNEVETKPAAAEPIPPPSAPSPARGDSQPISSSPPPSPAPPSPAPQAPEVEKKEEETKPAAAEPIPSPSVPSPDREISQPISPAPPRKVPPVRRPVVPLQPRTPKRNLVLPISTVIVVLAVGVMVFKIITGKSSREPEPTSSKPVTAVTRTPAQAKPLPASPQPQEKPQRSSSLLPEQTKLFEDPNKYYSISLPEGYLTIDESQGNQSKILFNYSLNVNITIIVKPLRENWEPQAAMLKKVEDIEGGNAGGLSRLRVENYGQVSFNDFAGYEILLAEGNQIAHVYELVNPKKILFSIIIAAVGDNNQENHDLLDKAVRETLKFL